VGTISGAIESDPDTDSEEKKAVFALSQLPKDESVPKLIEVAQNNRNLECWNGAGDVLAGAIERSAGVAVL